MNVNTIFLLFVFTFVSCSENNKAQTSEKKDSVSVMNIGVVSADEYILDSSALGIEFFPKGNYSVLKREINNRRLQYFQELSNSKDSATYDSVLNSARDYFTNQLLNKIIPHWYGTVWDFDGYTNTPNKGMIACGYFVSTTLKHTGLNLNRYKMAQQAGLNEARTLEDDKNLIIYRFDNFDETNSVISNLKSLKDGLYFVGLSNHVGYLYIRNHIPYFIHSNYIDGYVMIENAEYSDAFISNIYVIADITYNDALILKWIKNAEVFIVRGNN